MKRPPERWSSVIAAIAVAAGVRAESCTMPVPRRMRSVCGAPPGQRREGVGAVGLGRPHRVEAEPLGLLDRLQRTRRRAGRPVARAVAELDRDVIVTDRTRAARYRRHVSDLPPPPSDDPTPPPPPPSPAPAGPCPAFGPTGVVPPRLGGRVLQRRARHPADDRDARDLGASSGRTARTRTSSGTTATASAASSASCIYVFVSPVLMFTIPNEIKNMYERDGRESPVSAVWGLWFLLPLIGNIIWYVKVQRPLNEFWLSKGAQRGLTPSVRLLVPGGLRPHRRGGGWCRRAMEVTMNVAAILSAKGNTVEVVGPETPVTVAVHRMATRGIGSLVVVGARRPAARRRR